MIKIQRKEYKRHGFAKQLASESVAIIGSYMTQTGQSGCGLSLEEKKKWMPLILAIDSKDIAFLKEVNKYFDTMSINVPYEGVSLDETIGEDGEPNNVEEFIKYRFIMGHPYVAKDPQAAEADEKKLFYIENAEAELQAKSKKIGKSTKAYIELGKLIENEVKIDWILRALSVKHTSIGSIDKIASMKKAEKEVALEEIVKKDPDFFITLTSDDTLEYRAEVASMVEAGIFQRVGNDYINGTENLGDINAVIAFFKNPNESEKVVILKAKLKQFGKELKREAKEEIKSKKIKE